MALFVETLVLSKVITELSQRSLPFYGRFINIWMYLLLVSHLLRMKIACNYNETGELRLQKLMLIPKNAIR